MRISRQEIKNGASSTTVALLTRPLALQPSIGLPWRLCMANIDRSEWKSWSRRHCCQLCHLPCENNNNNNNNWHIGRFKVTLGDGTIPGLRYMDGGARSANLYAFRAYKNGAFFFC